MSRNHLFEVFVRVEVERGLNPRMTQDALHRLRVLFCRVHKPIQEAVSKVMETPAMASGITIPAFFATGRKGTRQNTEAQIGILPPSERAERGSPGACPVGSLVHSRS